MSRIAYSDHDLGRWLFVAADDGDGMTVAGRCPDCRKVETAVCARPAHPADLVDAIDGAAATTCHRHACGRGGAT